MHRSAKRLMQQPRGNDSSRLINKPAPYSRVQTDSFRQFLRTRSLFVRCSQAQLPRTGIDEWRRDELTAADQWLTSDHSIVTGHVLTLYWKQQKILGLYRLCYAHLLTEVVIYTFYTNCRDRRNPRLRFSLLIGLFSTISSENKVSWCALYRQSACCTVHIAKY